MRVMVSLSGADAGRSGISVYVRELYGAVLREGLVDGLILVGSRRELDTCGLPLADPRVESVALPAMVDRREVGVLHNMAALPLLAARRRVDVVHLPAGNRRPGWGGTVPTVSTVHDLGEQSGTRSYGKGLVGTLYTRDFIPNALRLSRRIVVISGATRDALAAQGRGLADKARLVHNGVDLQRFQPAGRDDARSAVAERLDLEAPYLLYPARLEHPSKNHVTLIRAFLRARRGGALPHTLAFVGAPWDGADTILEEVERAGEAVRYLGFVDADLVAPLYRAADAVVFPTLFEGFGLPALEALASGVPLLASDVAPVPEVVGDAALVVDCREEAALADGLSRITGDDELRARLETAGPRRAAEFSWSACAQRTVRVLREAREVP